MKYCPSAQGEYASNLTAKLLYHIIDGQIKRHATKEDIIELRDDGLTLAGLYMKPKIRGELEEFVISYFLTDLKELLPGFTEVFNEALKEISSSKLENYISTLEQECGSRTEAINVVLERLDEIEKRHNKMNQEIYKISKLKGKGLVKRMAFDSFGNLTNLFNINIHMTREDLESRLP